MIKRSLLTLTALAAIAAGSMKATAYTGEGHSPEQPAIYPACFVVDEIDKENDLLYLTTPAGMVYIWEGVEDYMIGDITAAIMHNNGTDNTITDDIILDLRYVGYTDQMIR